LAAVEAALEAGDAEGVPFVLNARTDAFLLATERPPTVKLNDAIERGRAFLAAGATSVFVPGQLDEPTVRALVEALGPQRLSVIELPGSLPVSQLESLGVARVSTGPWSQRVALTALADAAAVLMAGGQLPPEVRALT
jgi:2-methylisocitrate lyase-like PEP mutase family enzyme